MVPRSSSGSHTNALPWLKHICRLSSVSGTAGLIRSSLVLLAMLPHFPSVLAFGFHDVARIAFVTRCLRSTCPRLVAPGPLGRGPSRSVARISAASGHRRRARLLAHLLAPAGCWRPSPFGRIDVRSIPASAVCPQCNAHRSPTAGAGFVQSSFRSPAGHPPDGCGRRNWSRVGSRGGAPAPAAPVAHRPMHCVWKWRAPVCRRSCSSAGCPARPAPGEQDAAFRARRTPRCGRTSLCCVA